MCSMTLEAADTAHDFPQVHTDQRCPECTRPVRFVHLGGHLVSIEPNEIECPRMFCPECTSRTGRPRGIPGPCDRCGGTHVVGEEAPQYAISVNLVTGSVRVWTQRIEREPCEALYRRHVCPWEMSMPYRKTA